MHNDLKRLTLLDLVSKGHSKAQACLLADVPRGTLDTWIMRDALFKQQYQEARARAGRVKRKQKANGDTPQTLTTSFLGGETCARLLDNIRAGGTFHIAAEAAGLSLASFHAFLKAGQEDQDRGEDTEYSQLLRDVYQAAGEARLSAEKSLLEGAPGMWLTHSPMARETTPDRPGWRKDDHKRIDKTIRRDIIVTPWPTPAAVAANAATIRQIVNAGTPALPPGPQADYQDNFSLSEDELAEIDAEVAALDD